VTQPSAPPVVTPPATLPPGWSPAPTPPPLPPFAPHSSTTGAGGTTEPSVSPLGELAGLIGSWNGTGLNAIWTPSQTSVTGSDRFLQLAPTVDSMEFVDLGGTVPNRGLSEPDLFMAALRYSQHIESNGKALHFEDGLWLSVPATSNPELGPTVVRMASIPHGTSINAAGTAPVKTAGAVSIPSVSITPFAIGNQQGVTPMVEQDLGTPTAFRTPNAEAIGFDAPTLADLNQKLRVDAKPGVVSTTVIKVATGAAGAPDHGVANTAFLGPNATTSSVVLTIWLQTIPGDAQPSVLQYSQTVLLDFNGLSWPHVTVGTLVRTPPGAAPTAPPTPDSPPAPKA
jgi:hypothetical protein